MDESKILQEIIDGINDEYDMIASVSEWIDEDIFKLFDELLSKGINIEEKEKKELLTKLTNLDSTFFNDKFNIIYLKLVNLYNKISQTSGESKELYYIIDRFLPNSKDVASIIEKMQEIIKANGFRSFIEKQFHYDSVLLPYKEARDSVKNDSNSSIDSDALTEAIEVLDSSLSTYGNKEYIVDIIEENRKDDYYDAIGKLGIDTLAAIYCEINGSAFTDEEIRLLAGELPQVQQNTLSYVVNAKKR